MDLKVREEIHRPMKVLATMLLSFAIVVTTLAPSAEAGGRLSKRGAVVGAFVQDNRGGSLVDAQRRFERLIRHRLRATRVYLRWDSNFPNDQVRWLKRNHRTIVLSVKSMRIDGSIVPWRSIADAEPGSAIFATMSDWARRIRAFDKHIYLIFTHEPESQANSAMGSSADFVAAWRAFVQVFRAEGVRNVSWTWTMTDWAFETTDERAASNWYPGDDVVDVIGADVYNFADCAVAGRGWETFREKMTPIRAWAKRHPGKPIILPEWGSTEDPRRSRPEGGMDTGRPPPAEAEGMASREDGPLLPDGRSSHPSVQLAGRLVRQVAQRLRRHGVRPVLRSRGMSRLRS